MNRPSKPEPQVIDISTDNNPRAFDEALAQTVRGDKIIYHTGAHAGGRHKANAMAAQEAGLVALVQGRIEKGGDTRFIYIAQRTAKRFK